MSAIDTYLENNAKYSAGFSKADLPIPPAGQIAVVACMDARLETGALLGIAEGDAHIIRNAGGVVTDDVIRSLILSYRFLGTREIFVINHTGCDLLGLYDDQLRKELAMETGKDTVGLEFFGFRDLESNVKRQVQKIRKSPFIPQDIAVHGLIYDVKTGNLRKVIE